MITTPQALVLVPIAAVGFGGGYLIGKPSSDKPDSTSQVTAPATFQVSKSQPSIAALGAPTRYPALVRVHTAPPSNGNGGGGPGTTTVTPPYNPPTGTTPTNPPPQHTTTTNNVVTTTG
jgi:hypothetical protein